MKGPLNHGSETTVLKNLQSCEPPAANSQSCEPPAANPQSCEPPAANPQVTLFYCVSLQSLVTYAMLRTVVRVSVLVTNLQWLHLFSEMHSLSYFHHFNVIVRFDDASTN